MISPCAYVPGEFNQTCILIYVTLLVAGGAACLSINELGLAQFDPVRKDTSKK